MQSKCMYVGATLAGEGIASSLWFLGRLDVWVLSSAGVRSVQ